MLGKCNCYDNAAMETLFKTIKAELIWKHTWQTRRQAKLAIFEDSKKYQMDKYSQDISI